MRLNTALRRLGKKGFEVKQNSRNNKMFSARKGRDVIEFIAMGNIVGNPIITAIRVRDVNDIDDHYTDYNAGVWCDNLTQALAIVRG